VALATIASMTGALNSRTSKVIVSCSGLDTMPYPDAFVKGYGTGIQLSHSVGRGRRSMSAHSSGFSILPQMGYAVKGFGQLGYRLTMGSINQHMGAINQHTGAINLAPTVCRATSDGSAGRGQMFHPGLCHAWQYVCVMLATRLYIRPTNV
jgi:hypothetical protein